MFELDLDLPRELAPLAWIIGRWEGAGVLAQDDGEGANFGQEIICSHDGRPFLRWESRTWLIDENGQPGTPGPTELGFWKPLPNDEVELALVNPEGILELYYGSTSPAKIELRTDGVMRSPSAPEYKSATRIFGLVQSNLLWAQDAAIGENPLRSIASAELKRASQ